MSLAVAAYSEIGISSCAVTAAALVLKSANRFLSCFSDFESLARLMPDWLLNMAIV